MRFTTARLLLRELHESDLPALAAIYADPLNRRYESAPLSAEQSREKLAIALADQAALRPTRWRFAITIPPADDLCGWIALSLLRGDVREYEIGWTLATAQWGKGYATEAAQTILSYTFNELHAHRVIAFCHTANRASQRVMEKLAMQPEAHLRESNRILGTWHDEHIYAILDRDYAQHGLIAPA